MLWTGLRRDNLGVHFRRQHPEPPYTLDFFCRAARLCVEVDGAQHERPAQAEHDRRRDHDLAARGIAVWRVAATEVMHNPDGVLVGIRAEIERRVEALGREGPPLSASPTSPPASRERDDEVRGVRD